MRGSYGTSIIGVDLDDPLGAQQHRPDAFLPVAAVLAIGVVIAHVTHGSGKKHQWRRR